MIKKNKPYLGRGWYLLIINPSINFSPVLLHKPLYRCSSQTKGYQTCKPCCLHLGKGYIHFAWLWNVMYSYLSILIYSYTHRRNWGSFSNFCWFLMVQSLWQPPFIIILAYVHLCKKIQNFVPTYLMFCWYMNIFFRSNKETGYRYSALFIFTVFAGGFFLNN
jgi:hypothetical protein